MSQFLKKTEQEKHLMAVCSSYHWKFTLQKKFLKSCYWWLCVLWYRLDNVHWGSVHGTTAMCAPREAHRSGNPNVKISLKRELLYSQKTVGSQCLWPLALKEGILKNMTVQPMWLCMLSACIFATCRKKKWAGMTKHCFSMLKSTGSREGRPQGEGS